MRIFGESWRVVHTVAAVCTAGAVFLMARFTLVQFPVPRWRLPLAILTAILVGTNIVVVQFGTIGQAYGLALLAITAAFGVSVLSPERKQWMIPFAAGLLAGVGASATLLTAPVGPILLIWTILYDRTGRRWSKLSRLCCRRGNSVHSSCLADGAGTAANLVWNYSVQPALSPSPVAGGAPARFGSLRGMDRFPSGNHLGSAGAGRIAVRPFPQRLGPASPEACSTCAPAWPSC